MISLPPLRALSQRPRVLSQREYLHALSQEIDMTTQHLRALSQRPMSRALAAFQRASYGLPSARYRGGAAFYKAGMSRIIARSRSVAAVKREIS
jgi:hypothetical protein